MKKKLALLLSACLGAAACSRGGEPQEMIKITAPAPAGSGQEETWGVAFDSWAGDADRDLVSSVRQAIVEDPETVPLAEAVAIEAAAGSVVLRGSGPYRLSMDEWRSVGRRAKSVQGVKSVEIQALVSGAS